MKNLIKVVLEELLELGVVAAVTLGIIYLFGPIPTWAMLLLLGATCTAATLIGAYLRGFFKELL